MYDEMKLPRKVEKWMKVHDVGELEDMVAQVPEHMATKIADILHVLYEIGYEIDEPYIDTLDVPA